VLNFTFAEAVFGQFEFDRWVVKSGKFVVHGLHDFEASVEIVNPVLCPAEGGS
jgi:hypothetical protein